MRRVGLTAPHAIRCREAESDENAARAVNDERWGQARNPQGSKTAQRVRRTESKYAKGAKAEGLFYLGVSIER